MEVEKNIIERNDKKVKSYVPANKKIFTMEQIAEFVDLYNKGLSAKKIGYIFNICESTVLKNIKNNTTIRKPYVEKILSEEQIKQCILLYEGGKTFKQIGEIFNLSDVSVKNKIGEFVSSRKSSSYSKLNEIQIEKCIQLYESGCSLSSISKKMHKSDISIKKILESRIKLRTYFKKNENINEKEVIELYLGGASVRSISKKLDCSEKIINVILNKNGIKIRTYYENLKDKNLNHCFFNVFNNNSCYWAGFIAADGNVLDYNKSKLFRLSIKLSVRDMEQLKKFKDNINSNKKISIYEGISFSKKNVLVNISISSKYIVNDLFEKFNVCPRKSLILEPPKNMPEEYVSHFIRGYFDGDGWIYKDIRKKAIGFCGTKKMLEWIKVNIRKNCPEAGNPNLYSKNGKTYSLFFRGNIQAVKILQWMYKDSSEDIRLNRKYNIYLDY